MAWTLSAFADEAGTPLDAQIHALKLANYNYIDLRNIDLDGTMYNITELPLELADGIRAKLDEAGIAVNMFGSPIGKIDITDDFEVDMAKLRHLGALREPLGCNLVRLFSYYNKTERSLDQWQQEAVDRLKRLADEADRLGLELYHENEKRIFGDRCEQVMVLADQLRDNGPFKLIFDFDNFNQSGDDVWDNWMKLREKTDAFHLKDSNSQNMHVPIGHGNGQARKILADALANGWQGPLTLEPHLSRSEAVLATGAHGQQNQDLSNLTGEECFNVAAVIALELLQDIGAPVR